MTFGHITKIIVAWFYHPAAIPGMHGLCKSRHNGKIFVQNFLRAAHHFRESYPVTTLCAMLPMQHALVCPGSLWFYTRWKHLMTSFCLPDGHTQALLLNTFYSLKKCLSFLLHPVTVRALYSLFKKKVCHVDPIHFEFHFRIARKKYLFEKGGTDPGRRRDPLISSNLLLHREQRLREVK